MGAEPRSRAHLTTEQANPRTEGLDALPLERALELLQEEDARLPAVLAAARDSIRAAIELVTSRLAAGGRLFYVGAGTSGRLGVLDAVECPPTFQSPPEMVQSVLAGGERAMVSSIEGAEDDAGAGAEELRARGLSAADVVLGITASGTTPFVLGALRHARELGAATILLACVPFDEAPDEADVSIRLVTGPEVLQGSTRMKAGTATKLALNSISTLVMVGLGKVYGNRMVDVNTRANSKLRDRGLRLVAELCGIDRESAATWLDRAEGSVKLAVLMQAKGLDLEAARALLEVHDGFLRRAL